MTFNMVIITMSNIFKINSNLFCSVRVYGIPIRIAIVIKLFRNVMITTTINVFNKSSYTRILTS